MEIIICENYEEVSQKAAQIMLNVIKDKENAVIGLATGSTPIGLYQNLIKDHQDHQTSYESVITFNLDEYVNLPKEHPESYYSFMHTNLLNHININEENVHIPSGLGEDIQANCNAYEESLNAYEMDIQLLGVGRNGHIGFNEPGTSFDSVTHVVDLDEKTIQDNARFFEGNMDLVPKKAITMGIASIMRAKKILLVANGTNKADAIYELVKGEISTSCPVTVLRDHPCVYVVIDKDAASRL